jgi:hypothetical protein
MELPLDVARCTGTTAPVCEFCRRRQLAPATQYQWFIAPAWTLQHGCPEFIEPERVTTINNTVAPNVRNEAPSRPHREGRLD